MKRPTYYQNEELPGAIQKMVDAMESFTSANLERLNALRIADMFGAAALHQTTIIAQVAHRIPHKMKVDFSQLDWVGLREFRNDLVHSTSAIEMQLINRFIESFMSPLGSFINQFNKGQE